MAPETVSNVTDGPSTGTDRPLLHIYRGVERERIGPGIVALCGHVKRSPRHFHEPTCEPPAGYLVCLVCLDLR